MEDVFQNWRHTSETFQRLKICRPFDIEQSYTTLAGDAQSDLKISYRAKKAQTVYCQTPLKSEKSGKFNRDCWDGGGKGSQGKEALGAEQATKLAV